MIGLEGIVRFLHRLWRIVIEQAVKPAVDPLPDTALARKAHQTIAKVTDDIGRRFALNTPIAAVMELVNEIQRAPEDPAARFATETAVSHLSPTSHVAEELERLGHERLWEEPWPEADPALLAVETVEIPVQVNGKIRDRLHGRRTRPRRSCRLGARLRAYSRTSTAARCRGRSSSRASSSASSPRQADPRGICVFTHSDEAVNHL